MIYNTIINNLRINKMQNCIRYVLLFTRLWPIYLFPPRNCSVRVSTVLCSELNNISFTSFSFASWAPLSWMVHSFTKTFRFPIAAPLSLNWTSFYILLHTEIRNDSNAIPRSCLFWRKMGTKIESEDEYKIILLAFAVTVSWERCFSGDSSIFVSNKSVQAFWIRRKEWAVKIRGNMRKKGIDSTSHI